MPPKSLVDDLKCEECGVEFARVAKRGPKPRWCSNCKRAMARKPGALSNTERKVSTEQWTAFHMALRDNGGNATAAARTANISRSTAARALRDENYSPEFRKAKKLLADINPVGAIPYDDLCDDAKRAYHDFGYFRRRYFGRVSNPWDVYTANQIAAMLDTPHKEFMDVNQPPGVGKTTLYTIDLPAWLICRNRAVRIMLGSAGQTTARDWVQQLRRELEREVPSLAPDDMKAKGLAVDAEAVLLKDFGAFKPPRGEAWTADEFVVRQAGDHAKGNKEPTVRALGRDSKFLGQRAGLLVWDDLVDRNSVRTAESREDLERWWKQYAESRLEPGGLMVLQGQRLHADDLYQYVAKIEVTDFSEADDDTYGTALGTRRKYVHMRFKAHYDELCHGDHHPKRALPYNPDNPAGGGCLLDPRRLTYRDLMAVKDEDPRLYAVTYQQEDIDPAQVLVNPLWVSGGRDIETGEDHPGCWDKERSMGVIPQGLTKPWLLMVQADPSPTKFWAIQLWLYHFPTEQRFLIEHTRKAMGANDFLDYIVATSSYDGLLEDWWQMCNQQGAPFTHVIVERNAAQRFLLQYDYVRRWSTLRKVTIIGHDTYNNKTDPQYGVQALLPQQWKYGRVRLPAGDSTSRGKAMALVNEVTRYPESSTTDCVMAEWFGEVNLPKIRRHIETPTQPPQFRVPSWARKGVGISRPA